jgi:hypothetical protein
MLLGGAWTNDPLRTIAIVPSDYPRSGLLYSPRVVVIHLPILPADLVF